LSITLNDCSLYRMAEEACLLSEVKQKMSAVIYYGNSVMAIGINRHYTLSDTHRAIFGLPYCSIHAEVDAIFKAHRHMADLHKMSIYVHRVGGKFAKPCNHCMSLLYHFGIHDIKWSG